MASVLRHLFFPSMYLTLIIYAAFLLLYDLSVTCSIAAVGLLSAALFLINLSLPPNNKQKVNEFFSAGQIDEKEQNGAKTGEDATPSRVFVAGHRTLHLDAPENTLAGIRQAYDNGLDAVEFDVRFSSDKVPILFHDERIDRIMNNSMGEVSTLTLDELKSMEFSDHHLRRDVYKGEKVVTLPEAIDACLQFQLKVIIDVKYPYREMLKILQDTFKLNPDLYHQALVVCWSPLFLYLLRRNDPLILTGLIWRPRMVSMDCSTGLLEYSRERYQQLWKMMLARIADFIVDWMFHAVLWFPCGAAVILPHKDSVSREYIRSWKDKGLKVLPWPVNDPEEKQYFAHVLKTGYLTDTNLQ